MNIIDHGKWLPYKPAELPYGIPDTVLFARRESDGVDWYEYSRGGSNFRPDTVKFIAHHQPVVDRLVIGAAVRDVSMLFPANAVVCEITDYSGTDPQKEFGQKIFDLTAKTISDWPKHPIQRKNPMELVYELEDRIKVLEAKIK
jgi:hypothetical protein